MSKSIYCSKSNCCNARKIIRGFNPEFHFDDFRQFTHRLQFSPEQIACLTGRTKKTVQLWHNTDAPRWVYLLLYACSGRFLDKEFQGWQIHDGKLYTGTRITRHRGFSPQEIEQYAWFKNYLRTLQRDNEALKKELRLYNPGFIENMRAVK